MSMFEDIPVDVGIIYEGERIRWTDAYAELGGPRVEHKFELVKVRRHEEIEDGKVIIVGPDIKDLEKKSYPSAYTLRLREESWRKSLKGSLNIEFINTVTILKALCI